MGMEPLARFGRCEKAFLSGSDQGSSLGTKPRVRHVILLVGDYDCTLDAKNRLMIPAQFRRQADPETAARWYAILHVGDRLWLMPEAEFGRQVAKIRPTLLPKDEQLDFVRKLFARSRLLEPDKQGRVVLPEKLLAKAKLGRDVTLVGVGRHVEVRDRAQYQTELDSDDFDAAFRSARAAGIELDDGSRE